MGTLRKVITGLATMSMVFGFLLATPVFVSAQTAKEAVCGGAGLNTTCDPPSGSKTVTEIVEVALNIFSLIVGIAAVIMIMIGGFKYITSQGDSGSISAAKNTILYAVIGLVIAVLAQVIVQFVLSKI